MRKLIAVAFCSACILQAHDLGSHQARAQSGVTTIVAANIETQGSFVVDSGGNVYLGVYPSTGEGARWRLMGNIGTTVPIVAIGGGVHVIDRDGNFYVSTDNGQTWTLRANVFSGPTEISSESWGSIKTRYR